MIKVLVVGHLILAVVFLAWIAAGHWRIVLGSLLCSFQLLILTFSPDLRAHMILAGEARTGFKTSSWEVVRKVRDASDVDRLCAGVASLGLLVLVVARQRRH